MALLYLSVLHLQDRVDAQEALGGPFVLYYQENQGDQMSQALLWQRNGYLEDLVHQEVLYTQK